MLFESTTTLLRSVVTSLENGGEIRWDDHLEYGNQCLYELHQMSRSTSRPSRADSDPRFHSVALPFERAIRAIPHVKLMMKGIRTKDKSAAVEGGRGALAQLDGIRPVVSSTEPKADRVPVNPPQAQIKAAHHHKKAENKKRETLAKRKPARASAATSQ